jgi:hypothetical protein
MMTPIGQFQDPPLSFLCAQNGEEHGLLIHRLYYL